MENIDPKIQRAILKTIEIANSSPAQDELKGQILEAVSGSILVESAVFIPAHETSNDLNLNETTLYQLDTSRLIELQTHYSQLDSYKTILNSYHQKDVSRLDELIDFNTFLSSEYYNDFYKPQGIYHKAVVNLSNKRKLFASICLHRSQRGGNFSKTEVRTLKTMIPYLTFALENNALRKELSVKNNVVDIIADNCSYCVIILDHSITPIYMNQKAMQFLRDQPGFSSTGLKAGCLPPAFFKDCHQIREEVESGCADALSLIPKHSVIEGPDSAKFSVSSRLIADQGNTPGRRCYMVTVEEKSASTGIDRNALKEMYDLTERELEIALSVFKGLRNAEIAKKLYVSEITIKWHLQNIFQKMDVKNRTALSHKMIVHVHGGFRFGIF
ncbi:MAG: helix-turn-helix transcriptional regulator [Pseudomonadota bacterium]